jgi:hypothetical protein
MDSLTDEIESILYIAREVMGKSSAEKCLELDPPFYLTALRSFFRPGQKWYQADSQFTRYLLERLLQDTKLPTGTSSSSSGKEDYESLK